MHGSQGAPRLHMAWDIVLAGVGLSFTPQQSAAGATVRGTWLISGALLEGWGSGGTGLLLALCWTGMVVEDTPLQRRDSPLLLCAAGISDIAHAHGDQQIVRDR